MILFAARFFPFDRYPVLVCPLRALSGLPCPGCGGTRAVVMLAHGDVLGAVALNPLVSVGAVVVTAWAILRSIRPASGRDGSGGRLPAIAAAALVLNWAYLLTTRVAG